MAGPCDECSCVSEVHLLAPCGFTVYGDVVCSNAAQCVSVSIDDPCACIESIQINGQSPPIQVLACQRIEVTIVTSDGCEECATDGPLVGLTSAQRVAQQRQIMRKNMMKRAKRDAFSRNKLLLRGIPTQRLKAKKLLAQRKVMQRQMALTQTNLVQQSSGQDCGCYCCDCCCRCGPCPDIYWVFCFNQAECLCCQDPDPTTLFIDFSGVVNGPGPCTVCSAWDAATVDLTYIGEEVGPPTRCHWAKTSVNVGCSYNTDFHLFVETGAIGSENEGKCLMYLEITETGIGNTALFRSIWITSPLNCRSQTLSFIQQTGLGCDWSGATVIISD